MMPTILTVGAFRIVIYLNDHAPPHVHCVGPGVLAIIEINTLRIREQRGVHPKDLKRLIKIIGEYRDELMEQWGLYHG